MNSSFVPLVAKVLTPFYYHGLFARDGSATDPTYITDTALIFALRSVLCEWHGLLNSSPNYKEDLKSIPWRSTVLERRGRGMNRVLAPVRHTIDVEREGGNTEAMQKSMGSGNFKKSFFVHEVAAGSHYSGAVYGPDPFEIVGASSFVVRVGVGRLGMLELSRAEGEKDYSLNCATASLFGRYLPTRVMCLDTVRLSAPYDSYDAARELELWN